MSYDLYFCQREDVRADFDAVVEWAIAVGKFQRKTKQLWYENEETGVYFRLDFDPDQFKDPGDNIIPTGFFDSGLSFGLNYNRPSFFAHEAMPLVEELASRFRLCIFDPQQPDGLAIECAVEREALVRSWVRHNENAIYCLITRADATPSPYMPRSNSMYLWRYMSNKVDLQTECGEGIFVPKLTPVKQEDQRDVERAFVMTPGIPMIIPESEWVFLVRERGVLQKTSETIPIEAAHFRELSRPFVEPFEWNDLGLQLVPERSAGDLEEALEDLAPIVSRDQFEILAYDSFVDVEPRDLAVVPVNRTHPLPG